MCAIPDLDSDIKLYNFDRVFAKRIEPAETVSVTLEVASRDLEATAIDSAKEIYPEYEGTTTQNSVKFKLNWITQAQT